MAKQKKQKIVNAVKGKPAFYARYELNELRLQLSGPWTIVYQTDCGAIAERPDPTRPWLAASSGARSSPGSCSLRSRHRPTSTGSGLRTPTGRGQVTTWPSCSTTQMW
jgi:hypothetical protein